jgi:hypothetical protein
MAEYEERIKSSLVNLSDDEIYFRLKNNYYTEEAKKIAEEELQRRGAHLKSESEIKEAEIVYETFISNEKIKKFKNGNALIWCVSLFMFGVAQMQMARTSNPLIIGIIYAILGLPIYLLVAKIKNTQWTNEEIIKKYRNNFSTLLMILGLAIISVIVKMFLMPFTLANILDMLVLGGIAVLILNKKKIGKQIMAVYALGPILVTIIWGSVGNVIIWPFAFFASAQSLLIQSILNEESEE